MSTINRPSLRAKFLDYTDRGYYFITINTYHRQTLFGEISKGKMNLNPAGEMVERCISKIKDDFAMLKCEHYIVMPDHVHLIFQMTYKMKFTITSSNNIPPPKGVQICVQRFKSLTTNMYIKEVKCNNFPPFQFKLWQRNYFERLIGSGRELINVINYIQNNPCK